MQLLSEESRGHNRIANYLSFFSHHGRTEFNYQNITFLNQIAMVNPTHDGNNNNIGSGNT